MVAGVGTPSLRFGVPMHVSSLFGMATAGAIVVVILKA
jgi:hypothetical protein